MSGPTSNMRALALYRKYDEAPGGETIEERTAAEERCQEELALAEERVRAADAVSTSAQQALRSSHAGLGDAIDERIRAVVVANIECKAASSKLQEAQMAHLENKRSLAIMIRNKGVTALLTDHLARGGALAAAAKQLLMLFLILSERLNHPYGPYSSLTFAPRRFTIQILALMTQAIRGAGTTRNHLWELIGAVGQILEIHPSDGTSDGDARLFRGVAWHVFNGLAVECSVTKSELTGRTLTSDLRMVPTEEAWGAFSVEVVPLPNNIRTCQFNVYAVLAMRRPAPKPMPPCAGRALRLFGAGETGCGVNVSPCLDRGDMDAWLSTHPTMTVAPETMMGTPPLTPESFQVAWLPASDCPTKSGKNAAALQQLCRCVDDRDGVELLLPGESPDYLIARGVCRRRTVQGEYECYAEVDQGFPSAFPPGEEPELEDDLDESITPCDSPRGSPRDSPRGSPRGEPRD